MGVMVMTGVLLVVDASCWLLAVAGYLVDNVFHFIRSRYFCPLVVVLLLFFLIKRCGTIRVVRPFPGNGSNIDGTDKFTEIFL
jgi:hypothetical protein